MDLRQARLPFYLGQEFRICTMNRSLWSFTTEENVELKTSRSALQFPGADRSYRYYDPVPYIDKVDEDVCEENMHLDTGSQLDSCCYFTKIYISSEEKCFGISFSGLRL